jgi:hypothetical protein
VTDWPTTAHWRYELETNPYWADKPTARASVSLLLGEIDELRAALAEVLPADPSRQKVAVCEALLAINAGDREQGQPPIIPPTAIDWIGNAIVEALQ